MKIRTNGSIFCAIASFEEKDILKAAGWWWHPGKEACRNPSTCAACAVGMGKMWWTPKLEIAWKLRDYADPTQQAEFEKVFASFAGSLVASRATDAEVDVPVPEGRSLLGYQKAGIAYALKRRATLIGDEMGLGKTVQALGLINATQPGHVLVVSPKSLRGNWMNEARAWLTKPYELFAGVDLDRKLEYEQVKHGIWFVTFEDVRKNSVYEWLNAHRWGLLIADEAQAIKNPKAEITKRMIGYTSKKESGSGYEFKPGLERQADRVVFLTGTPLMNRPVELQPIAQVCDPAFQGFGFLKRYCNAHKEWVGRKEVWKFDGASNLPELQERLRASFMVRRLKADVLKELPEKTRKLVVLEPSKKVAGLVEREAQIAREQGFTYGSEVFTLASTSGAFDELSRIRAELGNEKIAPAIEYIETMLESVNKVIVFTHHKSVAYALAEAFAAHSPVVITGDTDEDQRTANVTRFQQDETTRVFIGTIAAAGVGLTLTAASDVVMVEQPWRPADVIQAEDRAHRMTQKNAVLCHHLIFDGTLDAHMVKVIASKKDVADRALDNKVEAIVVPELPASVRPARKPAPVVAPEVKAELLNDLRTLAARCDGAVEEDGVGFNAMDTRLGKSLAQVEELSDAQAGLAQRMLRKYARQLGKSGLTP